MEILLYTGIWPFEKFLGFTFFIVMATVGFWCLFYLLSILPYWLTYGVAENKGKIDADVEEKRKILPDQEGVRVVYKK